jgi:hypothetical protein
MLVKQFCMRHIDRIIIAFSFVALLGLGIRTVQNMEAVLAVEVPQETRLDGGILSAVYTLNAGQNKPLISNRYGDPIIEYSASSSFVAVDGLSADLWSHAFNLEFDRPNDRAFMGLSSASLINTNPQNGQVRRYQIEQVLEIRGNSVTVDYYLIPNQPVHHVRLTIGHYAWYFHDLQQHPGGLQFTRNDLTREMEESRNRTSRTTDVTLRMKLPPADTRVLTNAFGPYAIETLYVAANPKLYERTLVASETLTVAPAVH